MIWDPFERMLWGLAIAIQFMCAIRWLKISRKREDVNEKLILFGFTALTFGFGLGSIFWLVSDLYYTGTYINNIFYGDFNLARPIFYFFYKLGDIIFNIGFIVFVFTFERILKRTKYILTLFISLLVAIVIVSSWETYVFIQQFILSPMVFFLMITIFLFYAKWSRYELKAISSLFQFGTFIAVIGLTLWNPVVKALNVIPLIIAPILVILGFLIIISPTLIDPKYFSRARIYWGFFGILTIAICWFLLFFLIAAGITTATGIEASAIILRIIIIIFLSMFMLYYSMKVLKSEPMVERKEEIPDILGMFTRPQKVTEEEVLITREKRICLVCKNEVSRKNYICPECKVFYCIKCSDTLAEIENACWVCDTPFDESKPVKPSKKEEKEEISVEPKIKAKGE